MISVFFFAWKKPSRRESPILFLLCFFKKRDYPAVQGCVLVLAVTPVVINTLVDLLYALVDPRVKCDGERRSICMFKTVMKRFARRKVSVAGAVILLFFLLVALFGPMLCTQDPLAQDLLHKYQQPSAEHLFGMDYLGRDTFTRMVYGARVSLSISFTGVVTGCMIRVLMGVCANSCRRAAPVLRLCECAWRPGAGVGNPSCP